MSRRDWNLLQGLDFVRALEDHLSPAGYHVALTGSVLTEGSSRKDIDVMIFPHSTSAKDPHHVQKMLVEFGMTLRLTHEEIKAKWEEKGSTDDKKVEMWYWGSKRVDVFYPWE